jgi:hypothetical protein
MVYRPDLDGKPNSVTFYIYNQAPGQPDSLLTQVPLDTEGDKFVPRLCMACHGGIYKNFDDTPGADNTDADTITGANFLPFDNAAFNFSQQSPFTLDEQQESFRNLNAIVLETNPSGPIQELIKGWYDPSGVKAEGSKLNQEFVPTSYTKDEADKAVYKNVFAPYCRACPIAQRPAVSLSDPNDPVNTRLDLAVFAVFDRFYMPHAEQTNHNFWSSSAPADLARYLASRQNQNKQGDDPQEIGRHLMVNRPDDPEPDGCKKDDCSLREAIIAPTSAPTRTSSPLQWMAPSLCPSLGPAKMRRPQETWTSGKT